MSMRENLWENSPTLSTLTMAEVDLEQFINIIETGLTSNSCQTVICTVLFNSTNRTFSNTVEHEPIIGLGLVLLIAYGLLVTIALFGNVLVCHVIFSRRRMRTVTNIFIANLAVSDLLLITLNVPLNIAKTLMNEWLFGDVMCMVMNMSLIASAYASTFTLTVIALDRQRVLLYPLRPRILKSGGLIIVAVIWIISILLSLPTGIYSKTKEVNIFVGKILRCRSTFPSELFEQCLTVATILLQYVIPLSIIAVTYGRIVRRIWTRSDLGAVTENQHACRSKHKKKSIKMLMLVVIVFALCWMPLNLYHILTDLHPDSETFHYDRKAFFVCHWFAISSACYNPFIYCWLNEAFRAEIRKLFHCFNSMGKFGHPRDYKLTVSLSQTDSVHRSILYRRNRYSLPISPSEDTVNGLRSVTNANDDLIPRACGCDNVCLCLTPDSWKSIDAVCEEDTIQSPSVQEDGSDAKSCSFADGYV